MYIYERHMGICKIPTRIKISLDDISIIQHINETFGMHVFNISIGIEVNKQQPYRKNKQTFRYKNRYIHLILLMDMSRFLINIIPKRRVAMRILCTYRPLYTG